MRWHFDTETTSEDGLKLNDHWSAFYARMFVERLKAHREFFTLKRTGRIKQKGKIMPERSEVQVRKWIEADFKRWKKSKPGSDDDRTNLLMLRNDVISLMNIRFINLGYAEARDDMKPKPRPKRAKKGTR